PRGEVDAEAAGPERPGGLRRLGDRALEQAVPGEVEPVAVREPGRVELLRPQRGGGAAVRGHRPVAARLDERDDDAVPLRRDRPGDLDAAPLELGGGKLARLVVAALADEATCRAELDRPGGDVRGLPACPEPC